MTQRSCAGRVALVTGASQGGTGTAIALRLAAEGAKVAIVARTVAGLETTRHRIEALGAELGLVTNIRRADVRDHVAWVILDVRGEPSQLEAAHVWLEACGLHVSVLTE